MNEPIRLLEIIAEEVTEPPMDGRPGCALYKVPIRLSECPSNLWCEIFEKTWRQPPRYTMKHRPSIASVVGDKIVLDGTTIEEVKNTHKETLVLCVRVANEETAKLIEQERLQEEERRKQAGAHRKHVEEQSKDISFD